MILYLDASALVKRYVAEPGSDQVNQAIADADMIGMCTVGRIEVTAALAKAVRMGLLERAEAFAGVQTFRGEWPNLIRIQVTETIVVRGDQFAWEHNLRGYDAVHLAAASVWQEMLARQVTVATFDRQLWSVSERVGLIPYPEDLTTL